MFLKCSPAETAGSSGSLTPSRREGAPRSAGWGDIKQTGRDYGRPTRRDRYTEAPEPSTDFEHEQDLMRQEWGGRRNQVERTEGGRAARYVPRVLSVNELTKMKRQTKHIRIGAENHKRLKQASVDTAQDHFRHRRRNH